MTRSVRYSELVAERKAYDPTPFALENPSVVGGGRFDSDHIGPWTVWAHDLEADLMVVGQDWGDVAYFEKNKGFDAPGNPTNEALRKLLESIGRPIPPPPAATDARDERRSSCGVWLTNASLWLKSGGMSAPVRTEWFGEDSMTLLRAQVDLVQPRVIVALGARAHGCVLGAYGLPRHAGPYKRAVESLEGIALPTEGRITTLLAVYHCGARIQNTLRPLTQQLTDWQRVRRSLSN
ncbi:MAG: hypothetical protein JWM41_261 [Gemmatimonadetes bacterium]|nr:hypothetical protein [Gemmatimonadota bacterium]